MIDAAYVAAVAAYFLVLYPYIIPFVNWAVWAIEGLPRPPSTQPESSMHGQSQSPAPFFTTRLRKNVRQAAMQRSAQLAAGAALLAGTAPSLAGTGCHTRLDQLMSEARQMEQGDEQPVPAAMMAKEKEKEKEKGRASSPHRWQPAQAQQTTTTGYPNGVDGLVYLRVVAGHLLFHAIFCVLPFWPKLMEYPGTTQVILPYNLHDQD